MSLNIHAGYKGMYDRYVIETSLRVWTAHYIHPTGLQNRLEHEPGVSLHI